MNAPSAPRIAVTTGCPAGVGPEVAVAALARLDDVEVDVLWCGSAALLEEGARRAGILVVRALPDTFTVGAARVRCAWPADGEVPAAGQIDDEALRIQRDSLLTAIEAAKAGEVAAIVTAPVRKRALSDLPGGPFPGQTELMHHHLADDERPPVMCFAGGPFLLGLATVHLPLAEVPAALTRDGIASAVRRLAAAAVKIGGIEGRPARVTVLGVNPHAGEGGMFGEEEIRVMAPAVSEARSADIDVVGPVPADGFFASLHRIAPEAVPDAVLAAYHDQGLGPYKLLARGHGVNLTLGLTTPRTSPDHGTADDIAGAGRADATSMEQAIRLALRLAA